MVTKYLFPILISLLHVYCVEKASNTPSSVESKVILVETKLNDSLKIFQDNLHHQLEATLQDNKDWKLIVSNNIAELEKDIEKQFEELKTKIIPELESKILNKLEVLEKKIPELEEKLNSKSSLIQEFVIQTSCKEYISEHGIYRLSKIYPIEDNTLNHVTLEKENDDVISFEMRVAVKAPEAAYVLLSPVPEPTAENDDSVVVIGVGAFSNQKTTLYESFVDQQHVRDVATPDILSATHYVIFNIKISNGALTFGKDGDSTPLLTYEDARIPKIKYFAFSDLAETETKFYYDCPTLSQFL